MKKKILIGGILFLVVLLLFSFYTRIFLFRNEELEVNIGIIDGQLSSAVNGSNYITHNNILSKNRTHGDDVIDFIKAYMPNAKIYYYDASNELGVVTSEGLICGLNWMKKHRVEYINISMSSNIYSADIDEMLTENRNDYKVYASYNNHEESEDYPAMYKAAIGVGKKNRIIFKKSDISYNTNSIIIIGKGVEFYRGNSYLTLIETLHASKSLSK